MDEEKLLKKLMSASDKETGIIRRKQENDLRQAEKRKTEVDALFARLYEDWAVGRITEYNFNMLSAKYQDEQTRLDEQLEEFINLMQLEDGKEYLRQVYLGDLELARGNLHKAKDIWNAISQDDSSAQYEIGERFNRINEYDQAITCFKRSFDMATPPRYLDAVYSLAFLYTKLGKKAEAIEAWELILSTLASDFHDSDSESVEWAHREIRKLQEM